MKKQTGIVLVASLIILIICSFIAVGIARFMIGNQQDASGQYEQLQSYADATAVMYQAKYQFGNALADSTLRKKLTPGANGAIVTSFDNTPYWWRDASIWASQSTEFTDYTGNSSEKPRYRIEQREFVPEGLLASEKTGTYTYRVICKGGSSASVSTIIESYVKAPGQRP